MRYFPVFSIAVFGISSPALGQTDSPFSSEAVRGSPYSKSQIKAISIAAIQELAASNDKPERSRSFRVSVRSNKAPVSFEFKDPKLKARVVFWQANEMPLKPTDPGYIEKYGIEAWRRAMNPMHDRLIRDGSSMPRYRMEYDIGYDSKSIGRGRRRGLLKSPHERDPTPPKSRKGLKSVTSRETADWCLLSETVAVGVNRPEKSLNRLVWDEDGKRLVVTFMPLSPGTRPPWRYEQRHVSHRAFGDVLRRDLRMAVEHAIVKIRSYPAAKQAELKAGLLARALVVEVSNLDVTTERIGGQLLVEAKANKAIRSAGLGVRLTVPKEIERALRRSKDIKVTLRCIFLPSDKVLFAYRADYLLGDQLIGCADPLKAKGSDRRDDG